MSKSLICGKQGLRYTLSETARREVLDRLLLLNHEGYAEEAAQGLHDKGNKKGKSGGKKKRKTQVSPGHRYRQDTGIARTNEFVNERYARYTLKLPLLFQEKLNWEEPLIILITHNDGGIGKTSLAVHLTGVLLSRFPNRKTLLLDCDEQHQSW